MRYAEDDRTRAIAPASFTSRLSLALNDLRRRDIKSGTVNGTCMLHVQQTCGTRVRSVFNWHCVQTRSYSAMIPRFLKSISHHVRYLPLLSALTVSRWRDFELRSRDLGTTFALVMRWFPPARNRFDREAKRVFPNMKRSARAKLGQGMGRNMGRTLFEIYHDAEFQTQHHKFKASGPGLAALQAANAAGKGAIIVSGHFGQWEAVRAVIKMHGMESGAVYRPHRNSHYERRILAGIVAGGRPILATGRLGTKALVRHVRNGGIISILLDEKYAEGVRIPFLGHEALTSLSAAQLALKYDLPMIPAYGIRIDDKLEFRVEFEAPIPHTDSITMTRAFNDSLSARILEHPEQWYWMLRRWDDPRRSGEGSIKGSPSSTARFVRPS